VGRYTLKNFANSGWSSRGEETLWVVGARTVPELRRKTGQEGCYVEGGKLAGGGPWGRRVEGRDVPSKDLGGNGGGDQGRIGEMVWEWMRGGGVEG